MNAQNARSRGAEAGRRFFLAKDAGELGDFHTNHWTNERLLESARHAAVNGYDFARSEKTIALYVQGWQDAIDAYEASVVREQEEAARRAAVEHNPNTRFCTCAACSK